MPSVSINIDEDFSTSEEMIGFTFNGVEYNERNCDLKYEGPVSDDDNSVSFDFAFRFDFNLHQALGIENDGASFGGNLLESCNPNTLANDLKNAFESPGDCCCAARDVELEDGTFCLDYDAFYLPASYEIAVKATGFQRCTCCKNGFNDEYCDGQIGFCGNLAKPRNQKNLGESCPSTANCECKGSHGCARKEANSDTYICCSSTSSRANGLEYCNNLSDGQTCWSDNNCSSGYCEVSHMLSFYPPSSLPYCDIIPCC